MNFARLSSGLLFAVLFGCAFTSTVLAVPVANDQTAGPFGPGGDVAVPLSFAGGGESLTGIDILTQSSNGTVRKYSTSGGFIGWVYIRPDYDFEGTDSFTWRCRTASGSSGIATCTFQVSAAPVARDQSESLAQNAVCQIVLSKTDPVNPSFWNKTVEILSAPSHGQVLSHHEYTGDMLYFVNSAGLKVDSPVVYYYLPDSGFTGSDSFTWRFHNGRHYSKSATVSLTVGANNPVVANSKTFDARAGAPTDVALDIVEEDIGQTLTFTLVTAPAHGTVKMPPPWKKPKFTYDENNVRIPPPTAVYTPAPGYLGADSFSWKAHDGVAESAAAVATLNVIPAIPIPVDYIETVPPSAPSTFDAAFTGGHGYECTVVATHGYRGSVSVNGRQFTYTPQAGFTGPDSFTWRVDYKDSGGTVRSTAVKTCDLNVLDGLPMRNGMSGAALDQNIVVIKDRRERGSLRHGFCASPSYSIVEPPSHGVVTLDGSGKYSYMPEPSYVGNDAFSWKVNDGSSDSNTATASILVRAMDSREGQKVLLIVKDTLLPEIEAGVNRWKDDLKNEGYAAEIVPWAGTDAAQIWARLVDEYHAPGRFFAGATLFGQLPVASASYTTDHAIMNMHKFRGIQQSHIWISRVRPGSGGDWLDEVTHVNWTMDANHGYRTKTHRLPLGAYWWDAAYGVVNGNSALNMRIAFESIEELHPTSVFKKGGEYQNSEIHGDGAFDGGVNRWHATQLRYSTHSSCGPGSLNGPVNRNSSTYGGGNILSLGSTTTTGAGLNASVVNTRGEHFIALHYGESFGGTFLREKWVGYGDYAKNMYYGDLSLPVLVTPSNAVPVISAFTPSKTAGPAPLMVDFTVSASDPDGSIASYEWYPLGFSLGRAAPLLTGLQASHSYTYQHPHRYQSEVQVVDNWKARNWEIKTINVEYDSTKSLRLNCGFNYTHHVVGADYTDGAGRVWIHDQSFLAGSVGYVGGGTGFVDQPVGGTDDDEIFKRYRTGASFAYRIPVNNGDYWLRLHFADMQSTASGQRLADVTIEDELRAHAFDAYDRAGPKGATSATFKVAVADGELNFTVARNISALNDVSLAAFEVIPCDSPEGMAITEPEDNYGISDDWVVKKGFCVRGDGQGDDAADGKTWATALATIQKALTLAPAATAGRDNIPASEPAIILVQASAAGQKYDVVARSVAAALDIEIQGGWENVDTNPTQTGRSLIEDTDGAIDQPGISITGAYHDTWRRIIINRVDFNNVTRAVSIPHATPDQADVLLTLSNSAIKAREDGVLIEYAKGYTSSSHGGKARVVAENVDIAAGLGGTGHGIYIRGCWNGSSVTASGNDPATGRPRVSSITSAGGSAVFLSALNNETHHATFENTVIYSSKNHGVYLDAKRDASNLYKVSATIENCTIANNGGDGLQMAGRTKDSWSAVTNSIFAKNSGNGINLGESGHAVFTLDESHNVFHDDALRGRPRLRRRAPRQPRRRTVDHAGHGHPRYGRSYRGDRLQSGLRHTLLPADRRAAVGLVWQGRSTARRLARRDPHRPLPLLAINPF